MGQDTDLLYLRWLKDQPDQAAEAGKYPLAAPDLRWLKSQGYVEQTGNTVRITKKGLHYQDGD